eukprot:5911794-Amphidinium_carterae.1
MSAKLGSASLVKIAPADNLRRGYYGARPAGAISPVRLTAMIKKSETAADVLGPLNSRVSHGCHIHETREAQVCSWFSH